MTSQFTITAACGDQQRVIAADEAMATAYGRRHVCQECRIDGMEAMGRPVPESVRNLPVATAEDLEPRVLLFDAPRDPDLDAPSRRDD